LGGSNRGTVGMRLQKGSSRGGGKSVSKGDGECWDFRGLKGGELEKKKKGKRYQD